MVLSAGVVDGRNVWRADLDAAHARVRRAVRALGAARVWVVPSCSLLHVPVDVDGEDALDPQLKSWLAFARQKLEEVRALADAATEDAPATAAFAVSPGPVTILQWSFVRDDEPRAAVCAQVALALRDEVGDLEAAGIGMIQVDEPAIREGLPLRRRKWSDYLRWAVDGFRLATAGVRDETQIHTHMCYAEFGDILPSVAEMDADVLSIETSRSRMELLADFGRFAYPNEVGPGVYDIHSPRVPSVEDMLELLRRAATVLPRERLWVNPDCGLKTRGWPEVVAALRNLVEAARRLRSGNEQQT
jgi:methionine synthase II (cobalamin-independent)